MTDRPDYRGVIPGPCPRCGLQTLVFETYRKTAEARCLSCCREIDLPSWVLAWCRENLWKKATLPNDPT